MARLQSFQEWKQAETTAQAAQLRVHKLLCSSSSPTQQQLDEVSQLRREATRRLCVMLADFHADAMAARPRHAVHHADQFSDGPVR
ncbi:hypothetical protein [Pseudorhodoferax aquiterrae]|uniref:hypothetical protein n=1 Tax=Pseudorhodoferax aquiterrae TaxID=747304 RepID=UPI0016737BB8|nr:hypothetical protein [Pseudorhodoferax aquiterrae]